MPELSKPDNDDDVDEQPVVHVQAVYHDDGRLVVDGEEIGRYADASDRVKYEWNHDLEQVLLGEGFRPASSWSRGLGGVDDDGVVTAEPDTFFTMLVRPREAKV